MIDEAICGLSFSTQEKMIQIFKRSPKIDEVILYGSRAKGNFKSGSDIDLTIKSSQMTLSELLKIENEIDDLLLPYKVDLSMFHQIDNQNLIDHIHRVGLVYYKAA